MILYKIRRSDKWRQIKNYLSNGDPLIIRSIWKVQTILFLRFGSFWICKAVTLLKLPCWLYILFRRASCNHHQKTVHWVLALKYLYWHLIGKKLKEYILISDSQLEISFSFYINLCYLNAPTWYKGYWVCLWKILQGPLIWQFTFLSVG